MNERAHSQDPFKEYFAILEEFPALVEDVERFRCGLKPTTAIFPNAARVFRDFRRGEPELSKQRGAVLSVARSAAKGLGDPASGECTPEDLAAFAEAIERPRGPHPAYVQLMQEFSEIVEASERVQRGEQSQGPLFQRTSEIFDKAWKLDPSLKNSHLVVLLCARLAATQIELEAEKNRNATTVRPVNSPAKEIIQ
jgi:hypothetical protein